jgi:aminoglycoside phosphotransferase (APT) family kinase protein
VPAQEAARQGCGGDTLGRLNLARYIPRARASLEQLARQGLIENCRPFTAILDSAPQEHVPRADTLVHGDLYSRHLLVAEDNQLAGVIDWGDIHLGDPALDLAIAHTFLPPAARDKFCRAYGRIDDAAWHLARLRGLWHTLMVLVYGHDVGDADLVRESREALHFLAAG